MSTDQDIGQQMISQLFSNPSVMFLTAGIIGIMGLIPNMPHIAFLTLAGGWRGGWALNKRRKAAEEAARECRRRRCRRPRPPRPVGTTCPWWTSWGWRWATG